MEDEREKERKIDSVRAAREEGEGECAAEGWDRRRRVDGGCGC